MEHEKSQDSEIFDDQFEREREAMAAHFRQFVQIYENVDDGTIGGLKSWQSDAFRAAGSLIIRSEAVRGRCDIACGGGKTPIAIYLARALGAGQPRPDGARRQVLFCTSRNGVVNQLSERNSHQDETEMVGDFQYFAPELKPSIYNQHHKDATGDVVIMPYASLQRAAHRGDVYPGRFSAFLLDECHTVGLMTRALLEKNAEGLPIFGFSATPGSSRVFLRRQIASISPLDGIMKHQFLSATRLLGIETGQTVQRSNVNAQNFYPSDIGPLVHNPLRAQKILEVIRFGAEQLGPGWIRCHPRYQGFEHAIEVATMANESDPIIDAYGDERRLRVEPVGRFRKDSDDIIEEFIQTDNIDALAYVKLIGEGYNIPKFRWGLWTPPTLSYDAIEQAIGRGNRLDNNDKSKVFTFFQLIDTATRQHDRLALGWELFGVDRNVRDVVTVSRNGISIGENDDYLIAPLPVPEFLKRSIQRARAKPLHALDIAATPLEPSKMVHSLTAMWSVTGLDRNWMRQILFHGGYGATVTLDTDNDDELDFFYEEESLGFLLDAVAKPGDLEINDAADALGISESNLRNIMDDYKYDFTYLYPLKPNAWCVPRMHIRGKVFEEIYRERGVRRELLGTEIPMSEVADRTGLIQSKLRPYLEARGFSLWPVRVKGRATPDIIGDRAKIEPWIQSFIRAPQLPAKGFMQLANFCKHEIDGKKPEMREVFEAARQAGVKTWIFRLRVERKDYIERPQAFAVSKALERIVKTRADTIPAQPPNPHTRLLRQSMKTSDEVIAYHARRLNIPLNSDLDAEDSEKIKLAIMTARRDLAIYEDEPSLIAAVTGTARELAWPQRPKPVPPQPLTHEVDTKTHVPNPPYETRERPRLRGADSRLLHIIIERHPVISHHPVARDYEGNPIIDEVLDDMITNVMQRSGIKLAIPASWQYIGDVAELLQTNERDLMRFLVSKNISSDHIRYVELADTRGILAFCSPEFSKLLLAKARN